MKKFLFLLLPFLLLVPSEAKDSKLYYTLIYPTDQDGRFLHVGASNDSQVILADIEAANGIVHVIDAVLLPSDAPEPLKTIAEIALATPSLSTLVTAVTLASENGETDFLGAISDRDADLTVFAPTDAAFEALGDTLGAAIADPAGLLSQVLAYHVLGSSESGADLVAAGRAPTLLGPGVSIKADAEGNVFINDSKVVIADIEAANGIVHVIDAVLFPPAGPVADNAVIELKGKVNKRYLGANVRGNVIAEKRSNASTKWQVKDLGNGTFQLLNVKTGLYLDADSASRRYNVDLGRADFHGTTWSFTELANGNYTLTATDYNRVLDGDFYNIDTSKEIHDDSEWSITLVP